MARNPDIAPIELQKIVDKYFAETEEKGEFPTEAGMELYLDIEESKYKRMVNSDKYAEVFHKAKLRRMHWLENKMVTEPRCAQGCMNALKQEKNGGYADRTLPGTGSKKLTIELAGVGKNAAR